MPIRRDGLQILHLFDKRLANIILNILNILKILNISDTKETLQNPGH